MTLIKQTSLKRMSLRQHKVKDRIGDDAVTTDTIKEEEELR